MKYLKLFGVVLLAGVWIWLSALCFSRGGGITLKNLFIVIASGIIIFVPLWKKFGQGK